MAVGGGGYQGHTVLAHGGEQRDEELGPCTTEGTIGDDRQTDRHTDTICPLFTQPPMRRMRICFTDVFSVFFLFSVFFRLSKKYQTTVLRSG